MTPVTLHLTVWFLIYLSVGLVLIGYRWAGLCSVVMAFVAAIAQARSHGVGAC